MTPKSQPQIWRPTNLSTTQSLHPPVPVICQVSLFVPSRPSPEHELILTACASLHTVSHTTRHHKLSFGSVNTQCSASRRNWPCISPDRFTIHLISTHMYRCCCICCIYPRSHQPSISALELVGTRSIRSCRRNQIEQALLQGIAKPQPRLIA